MADTATFSAALKTQFIGPIRDNIPKGAVLLYGNPDANPTEFKGILASAENINMVGNEFRIPYKAARNQAVGFRHENETLAAPGSSSYTFLSEPLRHEYALFNITGQLLKASETNQGAFKAAFQAEMDDTLLSARIDMDRAAHGDGSGKLATCVGDKVMGTTAIVLASTVNFRGLGEIIDFVQADGTVVSAGHTVTGVNRTTKTITIQPGLGAGLTALTDFPVRSSIDSTTSTPNNSQNREIQGLESIVVDSGTLHGLSPVQYPWWKSYVKAVGGALSDDVIHEAKDQIGFEQGVNIDSGFDFALLTTRGIRRRYASTLTSLKQFVDANAVKLHGGFTALMFDENPMFTDDLCATGKMWGLALNKMFWSQMSDWEWMEEDGKVLKWEPRRDRYIAVLYKYCQLGTTHRGAHFQLQTITDDANR